MHGAASNAGNAAKNCFSVQHGICLRTAFDLLLPRLPLTDSVRTALFRSFALAGGFETKRLYERAVHSAERAVLAAFGNSDGGKFGGVQASAAAILLSSAKMTLVQ
mgnify:CR=1 FL=1